MTRKLSSQNFEYIRCVAAKVIAQHPCNLAPWETQLQNAARRFLVLLNAEQPSLMELREFINNMASAYLGTIGEELYFYAQWWYEDLSAEESLTSRTFMEDDRQIVALHFGN